MRRLVFILSACLILALAGCGEKATTPHQVDNAAVTPLPIPDNIQKLIDPYIAPDGEIPDEIKLSYADPTNADYVCEYDVFAVTFIWGDIFGNSAPSFSVTDWSGNLSVTDNGMVKVHLVIDFEPGQDSLLPVLTPTMVAWASSTALDFDGISFIVYMKRPTTSDVPSSITFKTEPFALNLIRRQLYKFAAFYRIDETRGVAVHSRLIWQNTCPGGTMKGLWIKDSFNGGKFQGHWMDHAGEPIGYMNGTFWTNNDGRREFSGSVSGLYTDVVIAELAGRWNYDDARLCPTCGDDHGYFIGKFKYLNEERRGILKGVFGDYSLSTDRDTLPYVGVWHQNCPYVTSGDANVNDE